MKKPLISAIAAISENRVIGNENKLLWHIPQDLKRFKELTSGHVVIMGRKTHESIGRPLPNRTNIVITRDPEFRAEGCSITHSIEEALEKAKEIEKEEIFIIGGGQIYAQALPYTDKLYLTIVHQNFEGDTTFPNYSQFSKVIFREEKRTGDLTYTFLDVVKP